MRQKRRHYHQGFRCLRRGIQKYWIPLLLGIVATIAVLAVWQQLLVQQQLHIQRSVQQEADAVEAILNRALSARIVALQQMANRWHISGGTKQSLWEADAAKYTQDYYGYQAIEWVDPSLHVRWIVPFQGNEAAQNLDLNQEPRRKLTLTIARDLHQTLLTRAVLLAQGGQGFLVCVPLFVEGQDGGLTINQFDGFILGVFRFQSLFDSILKPSSPYQIRIYDNKQLVYSQGDASPSALSQTAVVKAYGADWRIQVSPTPEFIAGERSPLPTLVLWGGLFGAWTLALTVYLGQRSERHVRRAKKINQQLQNEIIHRQSVEGSLRESEERLQLALEASGEGWWDWDIGTGKVDRSPQYLQLLGYEVGDFPEAFNVWETAIHPDDLPHVLEQLNTHLKDASVPYACDYRVRTRSGDWQWIADYGKVVVRDAQNQPLRMIGTFKDIGDRKHMESALRESEERWQLALRGNNDGIWDWNVRTNEVFFSSRLKEMLGFADHEMANHLNEWTNRIHPDDLDWVMAAVQDHFTKKTPFYATEHRVQCKDGTYKWILDRGQAIWDDAGNVIRMTGSHTDITERKQAEAALRKSEEALRQSEATKQAIIQAIPDLLIRMRADGRYVEFISNSQFNIVNPNHHRQDTRVHDVLPSDLARLRMHYIQQALQSGETQVYEHEILIHEKHCYEEVRIVPLPHEEVLIMVRDITARKQAEDDLRHQKQMFQAIVNHIPVMIALYNAEGRIEFINPELERVLGWTLADWQQQDILAHTYPDPIDRQSAIEHMLAATGHWKDFSTLTADQQLLETSWVNVPLSRGLLLGIGQDVSDRKQKERALRQAMEAAEAANLAKSTFLANMSHELRTPLNVILGFTQVMAHDPTLAPNQRDDLQTIRRSGDHLLSLINDILDLSKIEAGHCTLEEAGFDLISLLHTLRTMMSERANAKRLRLEFDIAPEVPQFVIADEQKLRQVLLNLLSNAIKFTKQGSVMLRVRRQGVGGRSQESGVRSQESERCGSQREEGDRGDGGDRGDRGDGRLLSSPPSPSTPPPIPYPPPPTCLQFEVIDTGVGILENEQSTIFDAFVQAAAGKKSAGGTGLGLTISRKLLELMHGEIAVQSIPKVGSTFTVTVPVHPISGLDVQPDQRDRLIVGLAPNQPKRRILVVDDQRENRLLLVRLLTQLGLDVREATNGQEAIRTWQEWHPDLTWMDIRMPDMDGYEATQWIREYEKSREHHAEIRSARSVEPSASYASIHPSIIIALTAQASQSDRTLALAAGCDDYISKPFHEETLFLKLKEYLGLEYLYAEADPPPDRLAAPAPNSNQTDLAVLEQTMFAKLSANWLHRLEYAAVCGDDRAIVDLAAQLPPDLAPLVTHLTALADQFQFEQILTLIHTYAAH